MNHFEFDTRGTIVRSLIKVGKFKVLLKVWPVAELIKNNVHFP